MSKSVNIRGVTYESCPGINIPLADDSGDMARFIDTSDATLDSNAKLPLGVTAFANGVKYTGTAAENDGDDLTVSGDTVTVPAGYYVSQATKSVAAGSVTAPASISGSSASVSAGTNTITLSKTVSVTPVVGTAGYVSAGTAGNAAVSLTASVTTKAAATITPGTSDQTIAAGTYLTGAQTIAGDADLTASNIVYGANIFGVEGSVKVPVITQDSTTGILTIS